MPPLATTIPVTPPGPAPARPTRTEALPDPAAWMPGASPRELLVALREPADLTGALVSAAVRARAARRPLSVVIVEPARGWTIDAAVIALQDRRRSREIASMAAAADVMCARVGVEITEVIVLRPGWEWTRRGRDRAVDTQLRAIARRRDADLHSSGPNSEVQHDSGRIGGELPRLVAHDITGRPLAAAPHRGGPHRTSPCSAGSATVAGPAAGGAVAVGAR